MNFDLKIFSNSLLPNDTQCELAFRSFRGFEQEVMLGLPFLHQYCMTVEAREKRVYFAPII
ncbi:unnamed protein product [Brugia pahangi]|uniref:Gag-pol polyprotein n=1 Tax=Brugia pahangi TaxID=6280 RepID=A0A0N4T8T8_BRUPA|nr:unnamed protein product [Brugia pahangi]